MSVGLHDNFPLSRFRILSLFPVGSNDLIVLGIASDENSFLLLCVADLIQKLLDGGKQLLAVRFAFEFGLIEKFPPVPLLKDYLKETKKLAKQVCKDGKNSLKSQANFHFPQTF